MKRTLVLISLIIFTAGCAKAEQAREAVASIVSYKDIPGITQEEISTVEALKELHGSFSYGHLLETEAFRQPDGTFDGFSIKVCELLSELFGAEFTPEYCDEWKGLKDGINGRTVDFTGSFVEGPSQASDYFTTVPVSSRSFKAFMLQDASEIDSREDLNGLRIGFLADTDTEKTFKGRFGGVTFESVGVYSFSEAAEMLRTSTIDVFIADGVFEPQFEEYGFICATELFSPIYAHAPITTGNPELSPIISVIDKYLKAGGSERFDELYSESRLTYGKNVLFKSLTSEEKTYLDIFLEKASPVSVAYEADNYPVSFYNSSEGEFQGIAVDVLSDIGKLMGIRFENATDSSSTLAEIYGGAKSGEVSVLGQLPAHEAVAGSFLMGDEPYSASYYALVSKADYPYYNTKQIDGAVVGALNQSAAAQIFAQSFPRHQGVRYYDTRHECLKALENGEIDLLMATGNMLLMQTNYLEKPGLKIVLLFDEPMEYYFGFSKNNELLRSVISKAQGIIDTETIALNWMTRAFDYSEKAAGLHMSYVTVFACCLLIVLFVLGFMLFKYRRLGNTLAERTVTLSAIYSSIPEAVFCKDLEGVYTSCNQIFADKAGFSEIEIIGKTCTEVFRGISIETAAQRKDADRRVISQRKAETSVEAIVLPDGSRKIMETLKAPLIQNGNVTGVLGICRDITEHVEVNDRIERIINTAQIALMLSVDNKIIVANEFCRERLGAKVGDDIRDFYCDPAYREVIFEKAERHGLVSNIIVKFKTADGEIRRFLSSFSIIEYDGRQAWLACAVDIEEEERINDRLSMTRRSLQGVLENLPVPVRIVDMETFDIVYVNKSFLEFLEYKAQDEVVGKNIDFVMPELFTDGSTASERKNLLTLGGFPLSYETEYITKTGKMIEALISSRHIDYQGRLCSIGIIKDLTAEKERAQILLNAVEREREANQLKSNFLANMSHEIRTPMNGIIGMTELLLNDNLNEHQLSYVNDINVSAHSLLSIINAILDFSKIEAGMLELTPVDYDFHTLIVNVCSMFRFSAQKKGLEFIYEEVGEMPKCLYGDDIRLRQVLTNLCGNAIKFTERGFIRLSVTSDDKTMTFKIQDTGIGIRDEDRPKLFNAFAQVDMQKTRSTGGTGLGLTISNSFVEMMGGAISVDSVYGQGTVFTVKIPKVLGNESALNMDKREKEDEFYAPSASILVVDDNEVNLKVAKGLLKLFRIDADVVSSGSEAISMVSNKDYDIVFMDHMMPEMDGIETMKRIRELGEKYKQLTVIALTANAIRGAKEMFINSGFEGFISKPIVVAELTNILREWLPHEKIEERFAAPVEENGVIIETDFLGQIRGVEDINADIGLSRVSGITDMYRETIELFNKKLPGECKKMEDFLGGNDLHNLAISVHAMKSSLSTIGAMGLSDVAARLEKASKGDELVYCQEHLPTFLERLRSLHGEIGAIVSNEQETLRVVRPKGNAEYLHESAHKALDAANDFDGELAIEIISKMTEYDFGEDYNSSLERTIDALKDFDFDTAVELLIGMAGL